jgi:hypothetical protein
MLDTLLLRPSLHCNTSLHFTKNEENSCIVFNGYFANKKNIIDGNAGTCRMNIPSGFFCHRCNPDGELAFPPFSNPCGSGSTASMAYLKSTPYSVNGIGLAMPTMDSLHSSMGYPSGIVALD